jgi:isopenicillin N synthase-like dioxygenase
MLRGVALQRAFIHARRRLSILSHRAPICLDYADLVAGKCVRAEIEEAYGFDGLGLLTVKNVPGVASARRALLPLSQEFAQLPEEVKAQYEHAKSWFSFGWSHGKEKLEGHPDVAKGSYYNNPVLDVPTTDANLIETFPSYCSPNIWPDKHMPAFRPAFQSLGKLVVDAGQVLAERCDDYVASKSPAYKQDSPLMLRELIRKSTVHKARLLHYFPLTQQQLAASSASSQSSWCGWHNDHGSLTGLTSNMFLNAQGQEVENPDPQAGLYVKTRTGGVVQVKYPADHLAFQIGEAAQIHSGGLLQATPHAVRGPSSQSKASGISRNTFAVFMQPLWNTSMHLPKDRTRADAGRGSTSEFLPPGVPPLSVRWSPEVDFGTFTNQTLIHYH